MADIEADRESEVAALLDELTSVSAVSGREAPMRALLARLLSFADELSTDALGNVIARLHPTRAPEGGRAPRVMLAAHMDEIGLVVASIDDDSGALRVLPVGGVDIRNLLASDVVVHTRGGPLPGIVGSTPPHLTAAKERSKPPAWDDLFIDLGLSPEEVRARVRPGDVVSFVGPGMRLGAGRYTAKALDNRAGLAAALLAFRRLQESERPAEVVLVATSQEEVGTRGAAAAAHAVAPDAAVAIDVGFAGMPGLTKRETIEMGKGPAVSTGANVHPQLRELLLETAAEREIPVQVEVLPGHSGTDAWPIQVALQGIPTGIISIPLRYMHSPVEVVELADVAAAAELAAGFCQKVTPDRIGGWHGVSLAGSAE